MLPERAEVLRATLARRTRYMTVCMENTFHPQNASALVRNCEAFGIQDIHTVEALCKFSPNVNIVRGTDKWVDIHKTGSTGDLIAALRAKGYRIVATSPHADDRTPENFDVTAGRFALFFGTEHAGISDEVMRCADEFIRIFEERMNSLKIVKMVPASGSASRMFKTLNTFFNTYTGSDEDYLKFRQDKEPGSIFSFFEKLKEFPFYPHLKEVLYKDRLDIDKLLWKNQFMEILEYILTPKGLNYNATPKGLIDFHIYKDHIRTAAEEHLVEAALYANDGKGAHIHFTVSEEHIGKFKALMKSVLKNYQKEFNLKYDISYSVQ